MEGFNHLDFPNLKVVYRVELLEKSVLLFKASCEIKGASNDILKKVFERYESNKDKYIFEPGPLFKMHHGYGVEDGAACFTGLPDAAEITSERGAVSQFFSFIWVMDRIFTEVHHRLCLDLLEHKTKNKAPDDLITHQPPPNITP
jgi:hypothetical protein